MSTPPETVLCEYRYDALDSLSSQNFPNTPVRQQFYCKNRLATEIQAGIGRSIIQHENLLLAEQRHENSAIATRLLAPDLQRSVLHTLAGVHQHAIAYSPYGHHRAESGLSSLLGFNGQRPDPVTGHYLLGNGYRAFNPVLMRFNGPDSLSPFGKGGLNAYGYCKGDPINFVDPTGHFRFLQQGLRRLNRSIEIKNLETKMLNHYNRVDKTDLVRNQIKIVDKELPYQTRNTAGGKTVPVENIGRDVMLEQLWAGHPIEYISPLSYRGMFEPPLPKPKISYPSAYNEYVTRYRKRNLGLLPPPNDATDKTFDKLHDFATNDKGIGSELINKILERAEARRIRGKIPGRREIF